MFDYARRMQQAVADLARRLSLKAGAGVILVVGLGFLLAALWSFLASHLGWGSAGASLAIGAVLVIAGLVVFLASNRVHHRPPTTAELKREVELRVAATTDAVLDRVSDRAGQTLEKARQRAEDVMESAQKKASCMVDLAGNKVSSFVDSVSFKADRFADGAEVKAQQFGHRAKEMASDKLGITPDQVAEASDRLAQGVKRAKNSNLAAIAPAIGAFAIGLTLASRLASRGDDDEGDDHLA